MKLKRRLSDSRIKSVVVADFTDGRGGPTTSGLYFADLLNSYLGEPPKKFTLASRELLRHELERRKLRVADLNSSETLGLLHESIQFDAIVLGSVDNSALGIQLRVSVKKFADQTLFLDQQITIPDSEFYESLGSYPDRFSPTEVFEARQNGILPPECEDCPVPQFRGPADGRVAQSRASAILLGLVITAEGRVANVYVLQGAGPEFEDMAWRAIRVFRFKPARNKSGQNVASTAKMQVFFTITD